jgi:hypothetical protein
MAEDLTLFRGTRGDNILSAINDGVIQPGPDHKVWFSRILEDALQHGADIDRRETYAIKAVVTVVPGASVERRAVHGNPLAIAITSSVALATKVIELYVRRPGADHLQTVVGSTAIKAHLVRARAGGA